MTTDDASHQPGPGESDRRSTRAGPEPGEVARLLPGRRVSWTRSGLAVLIAGGLLTGGVTAAVLSTVSLSQSFEIGQVAASDLDAASLSIPPAEAATHIADAKACRTPMAFVTLRARAGANGTVRIHSGDYWTPSIHLGIEPLRVALPYPTPYETGLGDLAFESGGTAFDVFLRPGWATPAGLQGVAIAHVWWTPKAPCP